jgi:hypothetical protein
MPCRRLKKAKQQLRHLWKSITRSLLKSILGDLLRNITSLKSMRRKKLMKAPWPARKRLSSHPAP